MSPPCFICHYSTSQGIDCFDYSKEKSIIVTGGADYIVRLWDPYVTLKPIALLKEHKTTVVDVVIHEGLNQVFSYSKDCVSKVVLWFIKSCMPEERDEFAYCIYS